MTQKAVYFESYACSGPLQGCCNAFYMALFYIDVSRRLLLRLRSTLRPFKFSVVRLDNDFCSSLCLMILTGGSVLMS